MLNYLFGFDGGIKTLHASVSASPPIPYCYKYRPPRWLRKIALAQPGVLSLCFGPLLHGPVEVRPEWSPVASVSRNSAGPSQWIAALSGISVVVGLVLEFRQCGIDRKAD